jgi:hypothetical protein
VTPIFCPCRRDLGSPAVNERPRKMHPRSYANEKTELASPHEWAARLCLRCNIGFSSTWAGDRICLRCKRSAAWRAGISYKSGAGGSRQ